MADRISDYGNVCADAFPKAQGPSDLNRPSQQAFSLPDTVESESNDTHVFFSLPPSSEQAFSSEFIAAGDFGYQGFDDSSFGQLEDVSPLGEYEDQDQIDEDDDARPTNEEKQPFRFTQDNLYEHHDPWHTIGVILGLSPVRSDDCILGKSFEEHGMSPNCRLEIEDPTEIEEMVSISGDPGNGAPREEEYHFWRQRNDDDMTEDWQSSPRSTAKDLHMAFEDQSMQKLRNEPGWKDSAALFDPPSFSNSSPTKSAQATAVTEDPQSPFRILLESRRHANSSSTHNHSSDPILALSQSSSSHPQSSIGPRTPPPCNIDIENTQSPFRALLAARNMNHKKSSLDFTGHSLSGSDVAPPPRRSTPESMAFDYAGSRLLKEVDGIFEGPCLFPDDDDASDED
ncbi:hypothetical protein H0H93_001249 [Arthromyces matolae]|nr:hypothetical protein H0H93_001249 [Arthromyces matolae]